MQEWEAPATVPGALLFLILIYRSNKCLLHYVNLGNSREFQNPSSTCSPVVSLFSPFSPHTVAILRPLVPIGLAKGKRKQHILCGEALDKGIKVIQASIIMQSSMQIQLKGAS